MILKYTKPPLRSSINSISVKPPVNPPIRKSVVVPDSKLIGIFAGGMGEPDTGINYGYELIDDGSFTTGIPWVFDVPVQWSIAGGVAHYNNAASSSMWEWILGTVLIFCAYRIRFTISGVPGNKEITFTEPGGGNIFREYTGFVVLPNGSYDQIVHCTDTFTRIRIWAASTGLSYDLDNFSLRKITEVEDE